MARTAVRSRASSDTVEAHLKGGREQQEVVGPIVHLLLKAGWQMAQLRFGRKEWMVPKAPNQASKREKRQSFEGFPVDILIFDSAKNAGDPDHALVIVETKNPDEETGVGQLERYMQAEPHVRLGVWANHADPTGPAVFVYRNTKGVLVRRTQLLGDLPHPGDPISATGQRLTFRDLRIPSQDVLQKVVRGLLDWIVAQEQHVTRREAQLDQLCGILLLKLQSDRNARMRPDEPPQFRPLASATATAEAMRKGYETLVSKFPDTFTSPEDRTLRFGAATLQKCAEILAPYLLIDVGVEAISTAFQVLRSDALKGGEGQYFTPQPVVEAAVRLLDVQLEDIVIDPACGTGGFLVGVLLEMRRRYPGKERDLGSWAQTNIFGIDKDSVGVKLTKAIMQIAGDGSAHVVRGDSIRRHLWSKDYPHLLSNSFANGRFSVVVTNPPFGAALKVSGQDARLAGMDIAHTVGSTEWEDLEIGLHFLQRAYDLLRVGGRLGIVLPETYFFSPSYAWLYDWLEGRLVPRVVVNVPIEAFMPFCRAKTNFYVFEKIG